MIMSKMSVGGVMAGMLLSVAGLGCGGAAKEARLAAASHVVMGRAEPPPACNLLSAYNAKDPKIYAPFANFAANSDAALQELRIHAADIGGNYVVVEWVMGPTAQGRIYACPVQGLPPAGEMPAQGRGPGQ
jgi:hypothetical protein